MTAQEEKELQDFESLAALMDDLYDDSSEYYKAFKKLYKDVSDKHYHIYKEIVWRAETIIDDIRKMANALNDLVYDEHENDKKLAEEKLLRGKEK